MARKKAALPRPPDSRGDSQLDTVSYANDVLDRAANVLASMPVDPKRLRFIRGLPHILTEWFSDPAYIGGDGKPRRLSLNGRGASLAKLIRRALPADKPEEVAAALVSAKSVRLEGGFYIPISRHVFFTEDRQNLQVHSVASWRGHMCTIQYNTACSDPNRRLLELSASNAHVPVRLLPDVHRRFKREGTALLYAMDAYLRDLQVAPGSEPTTCVGLSAVAWEDPMVTGYARNEGKQWAPDSVQSRSAPSAVPPNSGINATVQEAIERFVRILSRFGVSQADFVHVVRQEYFRLAENPPDKDGWPAPVDEDPEIQRASDVLAQWRDDARYLDAKGNPLRLRRRGAAPSFHALVRSVDVTLSPDRVLKYLRRAGAIRRAGPYYFPASEVVILRGMSGPTIARSMRGITYMLRTTEHNLLPKSVAPGWVERTAENARVPVSRLTEWAAFLEREGTAFLVRANDLLRTFELERKADEPTVLAGAGLYRYEEEQATPAAASSSGVNHDERSRRSRTNR